MITFFFVQEVKKAKTKSENSKQTQTLLPHEGDTKRIRNEAGYPTPQWERD